MGEKFKTRIATALLASAFFSFTLLFFDPSTIYFTNALEFFSSYSEISYIFITVTLSCTILLTISISLLKNTAYKKGISLIVTLSLLLWLQVNILRWDYGIFDGSDIDWQKKILLGLIDSSIWIGFIILAFFKSSLIFKVAKKLCLAFILIQSISLISTFIHAPKVEGRALLKIDGSSRFIFSSKKNIIILILDTFQTDIFQEIIIDDPQQKIIFKDFTYFRNALGGFPTTMGSIPLILTGSYYQNSEPYYKFIKKVYTSNSLPKVLKENGYRVHLFTPGNTIYLREDIASNFIRKKNFAKKVIKDILFIYDIALFRTLPHFFKKYIWNNQSWFLKNFYWKNLQLKPSKKKRLKKKFKKGILYRTDFRFYSLMKIRTTIKKSIPTFKLYHLKGLHPPLKLNNKCEFTKQNFNRQNYKNQAICVISQVKEFLDILKEKGIYDSSMIFIIGDHGPGNWGLTNINTKLTKHYNFKTSQSETLNKIKSGALPLFLVKPFKSRKQSKIKISDAPVSLADIPKTILSELGINKKIPGVSIFSLKETDNRSRRYLYHSGFRTSNVGYFNNLTEYIVTGFSWIDKSWSKPLRIFTPGGVKKIKPDI